MIKVIIEDLQMLSKETIDNQMLANKQAVQRDLNKDIRPNLSFEVFAKDVKDKQALKLAKKQWKKFMKENVKGWTAKSDYYVNKVTIC